MVILLDKVSLNFIPEELAEILVPSNFTERVLPSFCNPFPSSIWPAPENCWNVIEVVPTVTGLSDITTKPLFPLIVPSSINVNAPAVTSVSVSKSSALVGAPLELTV